MTDRDRQLMGMLATVRYLSMEQLGRLLFAGRSGINLHKRLLMLAGEGKHGVEKPYLKRLGYRTREGVAKSAWALTGLGYVVAESVLSEPPRRPSVEAGADFIDHGLLLNELYVQLLEAPLRRGLDEAREGAERHARPSRAFDKLKAGLYARAAHSEFRWHSHDEVRLPWQEYEMKTGQKRDRVIIPDATLELPGEVLREDRQQYPPKVYKYAGRRVFLEAETGSHTIVPESDTKPGATLNKLNRYAAFIDSYAGDVINGDRSTWYTKAYPDRFEPTLLFLVRTASRQESINRAIKEWRRGTQMRLRAEALTVENSAREFISLLGSDFGATAPRPLRTVTSAEFKVIRDYAQAAHLTIQGCRADARTRKAAVPEYPKEQDQLRALVAKLSAGR